MIAPVALKRRVPRALFSCGAWVVLGTAALTACEDDLPKATEITHMRILGAKYEVVGDELRPERVKVDTVVVLCDGETARGSDWVRPWRL